METGLEHSFVERDTSALVDGLLRTDADCLNLLICLSNREERSEDGAAVF